MIHLVEDVPVRLNMEIDLVYQDGSVLQHHRSHNIVVNTGRQYMARKITPNAAAPSKVSYNGEVIRYVGFGIGGKRQTNADALNPSSALSLTYPGDNDKSDTDVTVSELERPVKVTSAPLYLQEIASTGDFPTDQSTRFRASFSQLEINLGSLSSVPLSEIGLYLSDANPANPNGGAGAYPGTSLSMVAYDNFLPIEKTGLFSLLVRWEWRF